ncbi:MAG: hypothetical protein KF795_32895 [Labilithrix sp.]|nr:hypothetical protein [Labilithrix sp.]
MVEGINRRDRSPSEWGFHEEPPAKPTDLSRTGAAPKPRTWDDAPGLARSPSIGLVVTGSNGEITFTPATRGAASSAGKLTTQAGPVDAARAELVGANRRFSDLGELTVEVFRLKKESASSKHDPGARAALTRQIAMRQSEWVGMAKAAGLREHAGPIDPLGAKPEAVASAFMWSEAGGVVPRSEIAHDGGRTFRESVRDAVTLRMKGFDAMLDLHAGAPAEQKSLLTRSLAALGAQAPADASVEELRDLRRDTLLARSASSLRREQEEARRQVFIGLDGYVGTAEKLDLYEREQALDAAISGTTLGSIFATYLGGGDVERMRALGNAGSAIEGMAGGAGVHLNRVSTEREAPGTVKPNVDDFNRSGLRARFKTTPMKQEYVTENLPGNTKWPHERKDGTTALREVTYHDGHVERSHLKLEVREVQVGGKDGHTERLIFDAHGKPFDTRGATTWNKEERAIFVMNAHGELYASTFQEAGYFHHSSLAGGEPVAAAGELVVEKGKLVAITSNSGHYKPGSEFTEQLLCALRDRGVNLAGVTLRDAATEKTRVLE